MATFNVTFHTTEDFKIGFQDSGDNFSAIFDSVIDHEAYVGPVEFTPSEQAQTVHTAGLLLNDDILLQPIPTNYGKLTWNGNILTVS